MINAKVTIKTDFKPLIQATEKAKFKNLAHAAASIRKTEMASFVPSDVASAPGTPPHTRIRIVKRGKNKGKQRLGQFPRSIAFDVQGDTAVIGPRASVVGTSAKAHEFGGSYKGTIFPERSFAKPALQENLDRFADSFEGSIGR